MRYIKLIGMAGLLISLAFVVIKAQSEPEPETAPAVFEDVTESSGIAKAGWSKTAWGDFNNDGWEDLLLNGSVILKNDGKGKFTDVSAASGLNKGAGMSGGLWADYDNDGYLDIFAWTPQDYILWHNNKNSTFTNVTEKAGFPKNIYPTAGVAWGDFNGDGYVDLYLANYEWNDKDKIGQGSPDVLFMNNKNGTFTDASEKSGIRKVAVQVGRGVAPCDFNNDGKLDIYVTNYRLDQNFLWKNNGDGTFNDVAKELGVQGREVETREGPRYGHSIGACWGDIDNDGDMDLFCANLAHPNALAYSETSRLYINQGAPTWDFNDIREEAGIAYAETHCESAFGDYDKDGLLDLYLSLVYQGRPAVFYRNAGENKFEDVTSDVGIEQEDGWGSGWCDYDNDGNLDLATGSSVSFKLFHNKGNSRPYVKVKVIGAHCNKAGIGARITVTAGKLVQIREVEGGKGNGNQNSLIAFFGLNDYTGKVKINVRFPCGKTKTLADQSINKLIEVKE